MRTAPKRAEPPAGSTAFASARAKPSGSDSANGRNGACSPPHTSVASMPVAAGRTRSGRSAPSAPPDRRAGAWRGGSRQTEPWRSPGYKGGNRSMRVHRNRTQPVEQGPEFTINGSPENRTIAGKPGRPRKAARDPDDMAGSVRTGATGAPPARRREVVHDGASTEGDSPGRVADPSLRLLAPGPARIGRTHTGATGPSHRIRQDDRQRRHAGQDPPQPSGHPGDRRRLRRRRAAVGRILGAGAPGPGPRLPGRS